MVGVIDYGVGNLASIKFAIQRLGIGVEIVKEPSELISFSHLILPGVGSFAYAMEQIKKRNFDLAISEFSKSGKPLLGICLGMQLLFDIGEEGGPSVGLGLISGQVKLMTSNLQLKLPHVGWNRLQHKKPHQLLSGIKHDVDFYFVHSYKCQPNLFDNVIAECDYGGMFPAVVGSNNIVGIQFHPEKSQPAGLKILQNFIEWSG